MSATNKTYEAPMRRALELAHKGEGRTAPNPLVGAVIMRGRQVLGEGWHRRAGEAHAEVAAVRHAKRNGHGKRLRGATLIVTLEPCSTQGRTPACTDLIRQEGLACVVIGAVDPNPKHAGRGLRLLRKHGVEVVRGVLREECEALNRDWNHFIATGKPWVVAKSAMSLDGRISPPAGDSPWLTSAPALRKAHELRLRAGAIVVGAETVRTDNPRLTVRLPHRAMTGKQQPWRIIMTRSGKIPKDCYLLTDEYQQQTIIAKKRAMKEVLQELAELGVVNVLLEGGGRLLGEAFSDGLVNEVAFFHAPCVLGQGANGVELPSTKPLPQRVGIKLVEAQSLGADWFFRGLVEK